MQLNKITALKTNKNDTARKLKIHFTTKNSRRVHHSVYAESEKLI